MQMYGPRHGSRTLPWTKFQIFLETLFVCNNINTNLNKNFHPYLRYHSFKPLFLFFQISAKNSKLTNGLRQDTIPYNKVDSAKYLTFFSLIYLGALEPAYFQLCRIV